MTMDIFEGLAIQSEVRPNSFTLCHFHLNKIRNSSYSCLDLHTRWEYSHNKHRRIVHVDQSSSESTFMQRIQHIPNILPLVFFADREKQTFPHQQYTKEIPIASLHQENFSVLIVFVNESTPLYKVSTFSSNTFLLSTMSLKK